MSSVYNAAGVWGESVFSIYGYKSSHVVTNKAAIILLIHVCPDPNHFNTPFF